MIDGRADCPIWLGCCRWGQIAHLDLRSTLNVMIEAIAGPSVDRFDDDEAGVLYI